MSDQRLTDAEKDLLVLVCRAVFGREWSGSFIVRSIDDREHWIAEGDVQGDILPKNTLIKLATGIAKMPDGEGDLVQSSFFVDVVALRMLNLPPTERLIFVLGDHMERALRQVERLRDLSARVMAAPGDEIKADLIFFSDLYEIGNGEQG